VWNYPDVVFVDKDMIEATTTGWQQQQQQQQR
jgi:hypothetical protein